MGMNFKEAWKAVLRLLVFSEFLSLVVFCLNFDPHRKHVYNQDSAKAPTLAPAARVLVRLGNIGQDWRDVPTICIHLRALEMAAVHD